MFLQQEEAHKTRLEKGKKMKMQMMPVLCQHFMKAVYAAIKESDKMMGTVTNFNKSMIYRK